MREVSEIQGREGKGGMDGGYLEFSYGLDALPPLRDREECLNIGYIPASSEKMSASRTVFQESEWSWEYGHTGFCRQNKQRARLREAKHGPLHSEGKLRQTKGASLPQPVV